ncbi:MAG: J domain-containing protein [Treponema sp.]|jgi:DnaJ like chaperone protein|nr:J domain-containing protein [Treponema sp.]
MDNSKKTPALRTVLFSLAGPFTGLLLGALAGGIAGMLIGALLGALLQQLILRRRSDRKAARYFEAPGRVDFNEGAAGLSAYCALGVVLSVRAAGPNPLFPQKPEGEGRDRRAPPGKNQDGELIARRVIHSALKAFPEGIPAIPLMETFCKIALSMTDRLNPDLLAESLAARRSAAGDLERLGQELCSLAKGDRALREAASIRQILTPFYAPRGDRGKGGGSEDPAADDPWLTMGLRRGAGPGEIKSRFRKLAALYHPDVLQSLDEEHQQSGAKTFMLIQEAYRKLMDGAGG